MRSFLFYYVYWLQGYWFILLGKDIAFFAEVTSNTLDEDSLSVCKTQCLLSALNGYAPLIYELEQSPKDLDSFLKICELVWKEQDRNKQLPTNLVGNSYKQR